MAYSLIGYAMWRKERGNLTSSPVLHPEASRIAYHHRTSNERSPRKYSADPLRACNTYNNGHPLVALFFGDDEILREFPDIKDQALSKRLSKKFVGVVFTLEVALTNIAKIAIYRQTYNFSCSEKKTPKTVAFLYGRDRKIVGIVFGNQRKRMKSSRKYCCSGMIIRKKQIN